MQDLEGLKQRIDIVEVLSEYLPLRKSGVNYSCCCPFHSEKSGSFVVSPKKQFYHCFGCGAGGDAIKFLQEFKKIDFKEAVEILAQKYNYAIEFSKNDTRKDELNALFEYSKICEQNLLKKENEKILQWLLKRGLELEDLKTFHIGLAPEISAANAHLVNLGVVFSNGKSFFANRITFALSNTTHKIVGFSARTHPYYNFKNNAKYINSKESNIFSKSKTLYNFSLAKSKIVEKKEVVIVEGFMDCIALWKMGVKNSVATCGTAFNVTHLSQILRLREEIAIKLCFDKDEAGKLASIRAIKMLLENEILANIWWVNNSVKDIGEVLQKQEKLDYTEYNGLEFYIKYHLKRAQNPAQKDSFLKELKAMLANLKNFYLRSELIQISIQILGVDRGFFQSTKANTTSTFAQNTLEKSLLKSILLDKDCLDLASEYLNGEEFLEYKKDFLSYKQGDLTTKAKEVLLDESIGVISYGDFSASLRAFLKEFYTRELNRAKAQKDLKLTLALSRKIQEVCLPF